MAGTRGSVELCPWFSTPSQGTAHACSANAERVPATFPCTCHPIVVGTNCFARSS